MSVRPRVVVVGGVNIDVGGVSFSPLIPKDSNPGRVTVSLGGVGRNIAHNLRLLGVEVSLLTALGDDMFAPMVTASCEELGIDIRRAIRELGSATSVYIYVDDADGEMALALSDMAVCERITPGYLAGEREILEQADVVVVDTNIPEESIRWIAENCGAPIFADPVSTMKAKKLLPVLGRIHTLKPNRLEAELLSGVKITDEASLFRAARALLDAGIERAAVTLGSGGILAADSESIEIIPPIPARVRNATGAGDAFMAALVWAYLREEPLPFSEACRMAAAAAAITIESDETVSSEMNTENIGRRVSHLKTRM